MSLRCEILAIGDELTHGSAIDTNSAWLARQLEDLGLPVGRFSVIADDEADLTCAIREACGRSDLVIATGGLGPTEDDRTRHAAAAAAEVGLHFDEASWKLIGEWFEKRGRELRDDNRRQALLPDSARPVTNRWGTAPGLEMEIEGALFLALPGVPNEMRQMFLGASLPEIRRRFADRLEPTAQHVLRVLGPTEAALGARIEDLMAAGGEVQVGITAHFGLLSLRIASTAASAELAEAQVAGMALQLRERLGDELVYEGGESLAERVVHELVARGLSLATAESCTGGLVARQITDVPGSSVAFPGGYVTYSNRRKQEDLGVAERLLVEHGAVSEPVARAMADGVVARTGADIGVSITGIAGPDGGDEEKPVGTVWFALSTGAGTRSWRLQVPPITREFVRERSAFEVLAAVLRHFSAIDDADENGVDAPGSGC